MSQSIYDRELSPEGLEFQPGTRQASSLVEIPTPRVRFTYPTWTLMMDCYNLSLATAFFYKQHGMLYFLIILPF